MRYSFDFTPHFQAHYYNTLQHNFAIYSTSFAESFNHQEILNRDLYLTEDQFKVLLGLGSIMSICFGIPIGAGIAIFMGNIT